MSEKKFIFKSARIIGSATFISRILGFVRDILIAAFFGTGIYAQSFIIAFKIPNILRSAIGEDTINAVVVPVLSRQLVEKNKKEFWNIAGNLIFISFFILVFFSIAGIFLAPLLVRIIAPGFIKDPEKLYLTIKLTRIVFPYVFFIGTASLFVGILNSLKYFTVPAFIQTIFNFLLIISIIIFYYCFDMGVFALALAVLIGGAGQVLIQIPSLHKFGFRFRQIKCFIHPAMKKIFKLFIPRFFGAGVYHINVLIDTMLASLAFIVGKAGVAALYYANRLVQLPLAVFGIAIAQAALPTFSRQSLEKDMQNFKNTLNFSLRTVFFITLPATAGLVALRSPIVKLLFQRGEFDFYSAYITSYTLLFYVLGLCFYAGIKILASSFYAIKDTVTPVKTACIAVIVNIFLNFILMKPLKIGGLALATSISSMFNFFLLYFFLVKKIGKICIEGLFKAFFKFFIASVIMAAVCHFIYFKIYVAYFESIFWFDAAALAVIIILGILVYIFLCNLFKVKESKDMLNLIKLKFKIKWKKS